MDELTEKIRAHEMQVIKAQTSELGRPSGYNDKIATDICLLMSAGRSIKSLANDPNLPSVTTIKRWLHDIPAFQALYARAKAEASEDQVDEMLEIADNLDIDPNHKRIMIDTRKWCAAKLLPKKYGDKIQADLTLTALKQLVVE